MIRVTYRISDTRCKNPCKVVTQYNFMSIFSQVWYHAMTIVSTFRTTGVCPLNRHAVKVNDSISHAFDGRCLTTKYSKKHSLVEFNLLDQFSNV